MIQDQDASPSEQTSGTSTHQGLQTVDKGFSPDVDDNETAPPDPAGNQEPDTPIRSHPEPEPNPPQEDVSVPDREQRSVRRRNNALKERLARLDHERRSESERAQMLERALRDKDAHIQQLEERNKNSSEMTDAYYNAALDARKLALVRELREAKEEDDFDREVALQTELTRVEAQRQLHELHAQYAPPEPTFTREEPEAERYAEESPTPESRELSPEYEDWLERNPWADSNSDSFRPNSVMKCSISQAR